MKLKLALLGFGVVGQGLVEHLIQHGEKAKEEVGFHPVVVAISDFKKGSLYDPEGLDLELLLHTLETTGSLEDYPQSKGLIRDLDAIATIIESNADVVVEATYTNVKTGEPAITHCKTAFQHKKSVVMTNKGPIALALKELESLAKENNVFLGYEGTVMSGTPSLRLPKTTLIGNKITKISGILNGTTNYMITQMEKGFSYESALKEAQEKGYAEADPTSDVEGYDAMYKVVILANAVMGKDITVEQVEREGLNTLTREAILASKEKQSCWKMLGTVEERENGVVHASVKPVEIPLTHPLASIGGATNAITYSCNMSGDITLTGAGAGKRETGYALFIDLIYCHLHVQSQSNTTMIN
ncbi:MULTISPECIES: homoserine dehydrogenase [Bacillaceae]|uniref:Homoserine dehydrogenase n=1 Tax=Alkalicoccobacillus plakortidis TaxID=444060 RepID=A0A9D5HZC9_9BACI|nr:MULTISPECIES: homoserine dehydrogenase [Bacillaceae]KQL50973.1 homoserine dehydrogenase [Alkalicoccobacillus plakortidis]